MQCRCETGKRSHDGDTEAESSCSSGAASQSAATRGVAKGINVDDYTRYRRRARPPLMGCDLCINFDYDLAEGTPPKVFISFACLLERVNLIDDWMDLMLVEEVVHPFECAGGRDSNAANCSLPEDDAHEIEV